MFYKLLEILNRGREELCSDIHLQVNYHPVIRINGELKVLSELGIIETTHMNCYINYLLKKEEILELKKEKGLELSLELNENGRYRGSIFYEKGEITVVLRVIKSNIPELCDLSLPEEVSKFKKYKNGLVLITGPTSSGKTTTLASIIEDINKNESKNIILIEDPIEYIYKGKKSIIRQREVGKDIDSFEEGIISSLRQDPDIILIGEIRDKKSIKAALTASETGHLVFSTLHTNGVVETINRIIDCFSDNEKDEIRKSLSWNLRAVLSQELIKKTDGNLIVLPELMIVNCAISNLIKKGEIREINSIMEINQSKGMITRDYWLKKLIKIGKIKGDDI